MDKSDVEKMYPDEIGELQKRVDKLMAQMEVAEDIMSENKAVLGMLARKLQVSQCV